MPSQPSLFRNWSTRLESRRKGATEPPLRAELFGLDQLSRHAQALAQRHQVTGALRPPRLLARLEHNEEIIRAFNRATMAVDETRRITPAAEWLVDNFYLIEEQIQLARRHLPQGYSRELPRLANGSTPGRLRVYDLIFELVSHVDAQIDIESLTAFVAAYQRFSPLKIGELWAVPIMLRLALIENLQRIASALGTARQDRNLASEWVDRLQDTAETHPSRLVIIVADMARTDPRLTSSFVAEFSRRLAGSNPVLHIARGWLEQRLSEQGQSIAQLVQQENQLQASDQISVSHSIASLRILSAIDWKTFVERLSVIEQTLSGDPDGTYRQMDFATRDCYRHMVEMIARHSPMSEIEVAKKAIELAQESLQQVGPDDRRAHVGFYLVDKGQPLLERACRTRLPWKKGFQRLLRRVPFLFYAGGIATFTVLATFAFFHKAAALPLTGWSLLFCTFTFLLGASQFAVSLLNWFVSLLVSPRVLSRLDYSAGISPESRTMVVVPTILSDPAAVAELIETIEIHHLANRDPHLHFALLTDWNDAPAEHEPNDEELLQCARHGIEELNRRYAPESNDLFYLFHRPRRWNASENVWMGYERKRGKLAQLNARLRGRCLDCFSEIIGDPAIFAAVRYVITLDTDTQLPGDSARQLVGTMAHPLNRARFDPDREIVIEGYGLMQPRVDMKLASAGRTWFVQLHAGDVGIDPYTRAVSDVYQDLFDEGSFIGKGIYDVDAFERALAGRFPENTILSHDLLESVYARCALVTDVKLYEDYPARYEEDVVRRHRWIRGDWQIMTWLLPWAPSNEGRWKRNPLSALSRLKIFDNLRRSFVPIALVLFLFSCWLLIPPLSWLGTALVLGIITLPGVLQTIVGFLRKPAQLPWLMHLRTNATAAAKTCGQIALTIATLPYDALVSLDAILRTSIRVLITRKRLLEWRTSSEVARAERIDLVGSYRDMWIAPAISLSGALIIFAQEPGQLAMALPLLALWMAAPWIVWRISQPRISASPTLTSEQLAFLHRIARKTWHFFETFVTEQENWLPPDNFQEVPSAAIAARTSPTNIGLSLLANLAAHDFGYLSSERMLQRMEATLATMLKLERYRGHFYNWYDTRTLQPLNPRYISSVDSGNLAGHLLTLAAGLRELIDAKILRPQIFAGLRDTLEVLQQIEPSNSVLKKFKTKLRETPDSLPAALALLQDASCIADEAAGAFANRGAEAQTWSRALKSSCEEHLQDLQQLASALGDNGDGNPSLREIAEGRVDLVRERLERLEALARQFDELAVMDFTFLYDGTRHLFSIGYNVSEGRRDQSHYDLLASEARLCSYVTVAQGQVPQEHWFSLGRLLVAPRGEPILVSWSGSMFEYLMPLLVMPNYDGSLLDHACKAAVREQIGYGHLREVPWGVSESGYNQTDLNHFYQYRAFGVPGLGLKRGLAEDLVIAPYASAMALTIAPREACENLQRLAAEKIEGSYGFYEAVDYTPSRLPPEAKKMVVRSYMAHHQGMSFLSLDYLLGERPMQRRFLSRPLLKAADLLLQERVPQTEANVLPEDLGVEEMRPRFGGESTMRLSTNPNSRAPEVHLLSNGNYHVVISNAGGGYSSWKGLAITRWREDATRDCWGTFVYLRDVASGKTWSIAYQPTLQMTKGYEAIFAQPCAEFRHRQEEIEVHTQLSVSPEDDVELRRVSLTNHSDSAREIELTSYAEVVLAPQTADEAHPAFGNLFVQTEFVAASSAILCARRARSEEETPPWLFHLLAGQGGKQGDVSCETDRFKFIGRTGSPERPAALQKDGALSNSAGPVLDPIISLRRSVRLEPGEKAVVDSVIGVTESRAATEALLEKYRHTRMTDRAFDLAWTHNQVVLRQLSVTESEAQIYARLAGAIIYADPARRAAPAILSGNLRGQSNLWTYGISGDKPLVLLRITSVERIELVRQMLQAHSYWRVKGLAVDLVILNEDVSVYRQTLQDRVTDLVSSGSEAQMLDQPGGIFIRRIEQIPNEDRLLLQATARIVLDDENGSLDDQLEQRRVLDPLVPALVPTRARRIDSSTPPTERELIFGNGLGGFTRDGHEYVITLPQGMVTPAPWVNVLANPSFGTVVSEMGSAYTWSENAHEFRLTPWSNDPVQDTFGEAFYLRDEETGQFWSPMPGPARGQTPYIVRHGFGYTVFEHYEFGIFSELWVYVAIDAPIKLSVFRLRNTSGEARRISVTGYWEWVMGDLRRKSLLNVRTEVDLKTGALLARNYYNTEFPNRIAFLDVNESQRSLTGDRKEFLGRNGSFAQPVAMRRSRLSGKTGSGLDPCGAIQLTFDLADGQELDTRFRIGVGNSLEEVHDLVGRFRRNGADQTTLAAVHQFWNHTLGAINVDTPDPSVNVMANGWLLYQTLACRLWARTGFYQSGGAFGFRDQLQDVMALVHAEPKLTREHLLRAAAHQFREGDVQHWWHPPADRGVRTHFSDDFLWLPYATCRYVTSIADTGVLDESIPFLDARPVMPEEESYYDLPTISPESATLYEHCVRAIEHGLRFGAHGLPLMGSGDWNDGMNLVGKGGQGESVWLAFFLYEVLTKFAELARARDDNAFADKCIEQSRQLQANIEKNAWDGAWYRRAYFDNGEPLGSKTNPECQIDSLPQSWSIISGAGDPARSEKAMQAVDERLVRRKSRLIQLFDPPFDRSSLNPGYIKGYIPGVRENGGQYTHSAIWTVMAFASLGETAKAWELFTLLNPVHHGGTPDQIATYKVEPYVAAADVYAVQPHTGRGGWTWYTGSAGWMYRLLVETLLGVRLENNHVHLTPRFAPGWSSYKVHYRFQETVYHITVMRTDDAADTVPGLTLDGQPLEGTAIPLTNDTIEHFVEFRTN